MIVCLLCLVVLIQLAWVVILHVEVEKLKGELPRAKARKLANNGLISERRSDTKGSRSFTIG